MKILVIDNYDSFTYNLVYILRQTEAEVDVFRNDKIAAKDCLNYDAIILSPGPGVPKDAGDLTEIIEVCAGKVPMLGVCLGHQAIAEYLGGKLRMLDKVYHGVQSTLTLNKGETLLFNDLPLSLEVGRYHSWDVAPMKAEQYKVTAIADDGSIMAIENKKKHLYGIQFHPESILTPKGASIVRNFIRICKECL